MGGDCWCWLSVEGEGSIPGTEVISPTKGRIPAMAKADGSLVKALRALKHEIRMLRAEHKADLAQLRRQYRAGIKRLTQRRRSN